MPWRLNEMLLFSESCWCTMQLKHTLEISYKDFIQVTLGDIFVGLCREEDPNGGCLYWFVHRGRSKLAMIKVRLCFQSRKRLYNHQCKLNPFHYSSFILYFATSLLYYKATRCINNQYKIHPWQMKWNLYSY